MFNSTTPDFSFSKLFSRNSVSSIDQFCNSSSKYVYKLSSARSCLEATLISLISHSSKIHRIYVPKFRCDSIHLKNLSSKNYILIEYDVDTTLNPKFIFEDCDILILINYYGVAIRENYINELKIRHPKLIIILDNAHSIPSFSDLKINVDIIIYSLKKILPVLDGGLILSNLKLFNKYDDQIRFKFHMKLFLKKIILSIDSKNCLFSIRKFLIYHTYFHRSLISEKDKLIYNTDKNLRDYCKISLFSDWYSNKFDINNIRKLCRLRYKLIQKFIISQNFAWCDYSYEIDEISSPIALPIMFSSPNIADKFFIHMLASGYGCGLFWKSTVEGCNLFNRILCIPLINDFDLKKIKNTLLKFNPNYED